MGCLWDFYGMFMGSKFFICDELKLFGILVVAIEMLMIII